MKEPLIVKIAKKRFKNIKSQMVHFTGDAKADDLLNDLQNYPHAFVLACLMDRQIKAERAWAIPFKVCEEIGSFKIKALYKVPLKEIVKVFETKKLHRFNTVMAKIFHNAVKDIMEKYSGNSAKIWNKKPSSSSVVCKFLEFKGGGIKIATMAANILARQFRIPFSDYYSIDISPDVHIKRVMKRMGFVEKDANNDMIIYKARELNPEFPGVIDFSCWEIGRNWCKPRNPDCANCIVFAECKKILT